MAISSGTFLLSFVTFFFAFVTASITKRENDPWLLAASSSVNVAPSNCQDVNGALNASCWDALAVQPYFEKFQQTCNPAHEEPSSICFCAKGLAWTTCYLADVSVSVCGISRCKNSDGKQVDYSCLDLANTDGACTAPKYKNPLSANQGRVYFASAATVAFYRYAQVWYQAILEESSLEGIQRYLDFFKSKNRLEISPDTFSDVHYALGRFMSYYAINGTIDLLVGPSIVSERQQASSPLTPASMSPATLQQQLATTLNETIALMLSSWTDKRFFEFSQQGNLFLQDRVTTQDRAKVIARGNVSIPLNSVWTRSI